MKKIVITAIVLVLVLLSIFTITSCQSTEPETYGFEFYDIIKDYNPKEERDFNKIEFDHDFGNDLANQNELENYKTYYLNYKYPLVVKKVSSYTYCWEDTYDNGSGVITECYAITISSFEVLCNLNDGHQFAEKKYNAGDIIKVLEPFGVDKSGNLIVNPIHYNSTLPTSFDEIYFLGFSGVLNYAIDHHLYPHPNAKELPFDMLNGCVWWQDTVKLSEEDYKAAIDYLNATSPRIWIESEKDTPKNRYINLLVDTWERYVTLEQMDKPIIDNNDNLIVYIILTIESIALVIIAIMTRKRSRSTPSGTPPTVEQNSPDAQDTPDTPEAQIQTTSPPDVTEPPDPPKEE